MKKKFVIGIGSQRAGSTLVHLLISELASNIYMHPLKELHYFDTLYNVRPQSALTNFSKRQLEREINKICTSSSYQFINCAFKNYLRTNFLLMTTPVEQLKYTDMFLDAPKNVDYYGETTPEYMVLPKHGISKLAQEVGADAKIFLVIRNPVKRLLSAFKLYNVYNSLNLSNDEANNLLTNLLTQESGWITVQDMFNDYKTAIENYSVFFSKLFVLRYDDFFDNHEALYERLCEFIDEPISHDKFKGFISQQKNKLGDDFLINDDIKLMLDSRYRVSSEYISDYFGKTCVF
jgi:hypothetical protein